MKLILIAMLYLALPQAASAKEGWPTQRGKANGVRVLHVQILENQEPFSPRPDPVKLFKSYFAR